MVYFILLTLIEKKTKRNFILSKLYVIFKDIINLNVFSYEEIFVSSTGFISSVPL